MDIGIPQKLAGVSDTVYFNEDFATGHGTAQYMIQKVSGFDGAGVRNPVTMRPHKSGGIVHAFKRAARVFTVEGVIVADSVASRWAASDKLRGVTDSISEATDGRYTITPPYGLDRYIDCRLYDQEDLSGLDNGPAGPKSFALTFIAGDWRWYSAADSVTLLNSSSGNFVPNIGNTDAWLNFKVQCHSGTPVLAFSITQEDTGQMVDWVDDGLPFGLDGGAGHDEGDLNMLDETFYLGNQHNLLGGIVLDDTDFFPIPPGGCDVSYFSDDFDSDVLVEVRSAWV